MIYMTCLALKMSPHIHLYTPDVPQSFSLLPIIIISIYIYIYIYWYLAKIIKNIYRCIDGVYVAICLIQQSILHYLLILIIMV